MFGRSKSSPQIDKAVAQSVNYEVSLAELASRSEKRAWFTAAALMLLALVLAGGYLFLLPLKERVPYLVMANAYTGTARLAKLSSGMNSLDTDARRAINRANLAQYVVTRESYDYELLRARDWGLVFMMSTSDVASTYRALYAGSNPNSPVALYGKSSSVRVNIINVDSEDEGWFGKKGLATVRFQRVQVNRTNGSAQILDTRQAAIRYTYDQELPLSDEQRFDNPLGFQVIEYRVERELVGLPVEAGEAMQGMQNPSPNAAAGSGQQVDAAGMPISNATMVPSAPTTAQPGATGGVPTASGFAVPPPPGDPSQPIQPPAPGTNNPNGATNR